MTGGTRAAVRIFATGLDHPECVAVAPDGTIWAGGEDGQVYVVTSQGTVREIARTDAFCGGLAFDRDGSCFVCSTPGRVLRVQADGRWEVFATTAGDEPLRVPNFPVFAPDGTLFVSDSGSWETADGTIVRCWPDGRTEVHHAGPFHYANGLAIDAAGEYLYIVESGTASVSRIRIADGPRAVPGYVCPPGSLPWVPDGIAFDATGTLYATTYATDRIFRIVPGGLPEIIAEDHFAQALNRPTNCAFGGPAFDQLFIANLGGRHLSVIDLGVPGQPLYAGPRPGGG